MTDETLQVGSTMSDEVAPGVAADSFFDRHHLRNLVVTKW